MQVYKHFFPTKNNVISILLSFILFADEQFMKHYFDLHFSANETMVISSMDDALKRIGEISDFSLKLSEVLQFVVKDHIDFKNIVKKDSEALKADLEKKSKANLDQLEADTNRLKEILKRENEGMD